MSDREYYEVPVSELNSMYGRKRRGCFFYGCLTVFILMIVGVSFVAISTFFLTRQITNLVAANAENAAAPLPEVPPATEDEVKALQDKLEAYGKALEAEDGVKDLEPLELTETQINQLIQTEPELKGRVYFDLEPDKVTGKVSLPLDPFAEFFLFRKLKGKYLNGEGDFTAEITEREGLLVVRLTSLRLANGKTLPAQAQAALGRENLAKDLNTNPEVVRIVRKLARIEILKDSVRLVPLDFELRRRIDGKVSADKPADAPKDDTPKNAAEAPAKPSEAEFDKAVDDFRKEANMS
jgi:hypothetical protein